MKRGLGLDDGDQYDLYCIFILAKNIEQRVAQLERELAFLKSQGLTRDEQDSLLDSAGPDASSRSKNLLWTIVALQWFLTIGLVIFLFLRYESLDVSASKALAPPLKVQPPVKGQPFLLPGMRRP